MAQLVALMSGVVLGGVAEVVGSNLARGKIFTASIGSVDSLYPSVYIYIQHLSAQLIHYIPLSKETINKGANQTARMCRLVCVFVVRKTRRKVFSNRGTCVLVLKRTVAFTT